MYGLMLLQVKEHSDFSFLSLIFGSQGDTQKQLEKVSHLLMSSLLFAATVSYIGLVLTAFCVSLSHFLLALFLTQIDYYSL